MKKTVQFLCAISLAAIILSLMAACGATIETEDLVPKEKIENSSLYVKKVEDLPDDFILGMDVSSVLAEEASGVKYYDFNGNEQDVFRTLAQSGVNTVRVRVWNDPFTADKKGYGGGNCTIDTALEIGKRATAVGMGLLVDFHYSDFWADPGKQMVPKAWKDMDVPTKSQALYEYTRDSLKKLKKAGVKVTMVQLGNETNGALCGEKVWFDIQSLLASGSKAVREVFPKALVAVHFANPEKAGAYAGYAKKLDYYGIDYDVFASSYYPFWHGTLENLSEVLGAVAENYGKKVMVMETSYAYTSQDSDFSGNTISDGGAIVKDYPFTVQGQANNFRNVANAVAHTKNGIGVVYWEGAWITVGGDSYEANAVKWQKYGSGWATSYAAEYDPDDAGKYYGGCAVDNQAMFDPQGKPLESLRVFNLLRFGNEIETKVDAIADSELVCDLNETIVLPETANAVMTDDSKEAVPVQWNVTQEELDRMHTAGVAKYTVKGVAGGREATLYISMIEFNYLTNYSFETGDLTGWKVIENGKADELFVENKQTDSLTGSWHMHFWSAAANSVDFTLSQEVRDLSPGNYKFSISVMGGDGGETEIYAFVKVDGQTVSTAPMQMTVYNEWHQGVVRGVRLEEGQTLEVGISVKCAGTGAGAWGKIDDAMLNSEA